MATKKISELTALTTPESDDLIAIVDASATETKKITYGNISKHIVNVGTEVEEDSKVNFIKSKNLFDKNNLKIAVYDYSTTGVVPPKVSSTTRCAIGPDVSIKVKPNTKYTFSSNNNIRVAIGELKGDKTLIQSASWTQNALTITTTANTEYIIFNIDYNNGATITSAIFTTIQNAIMFNEGETSLPYEPYIPNQIVIDDETFTDTIKVSNEVDGKSRVNVLKSKNIVQTSNIYMQQGLKSEDGTMASVASRVTIYKVPIKPNTQYTLSCASGYQIGNVFQYNSSGTYTSTAESSFATSKQYTSTSTTYYISFVLKNDANTTIDPSEINNIKVQIEQGSSATTYEPMQPNQIVVDNEKYSDTINVGQFDSRSRVNVLKSKNLLRTSLELGTYSNDGVKAGSTANYRTANMVKVKPNTTYTTSINGVAQNYAVYLYNSSMTFLDSATTSTFTTPANCEYLNFRCFNADFTSDFANLKVQLEEGSTATTYEPYITPSINVDGEEIYNKYNPIKNLWTGTAYNQGDALKLTEPLEAGSLYMVQFLGNSSVYLNTDFFYYYGSYQNEALAQINYYSYPDTIGFRYRLRYNENNNTITLFEVQNSASNRAIKYIFKVK